MSDCSSRPWWDQLQTDIQASKHQHGYSFAQLATIRGPASGHLASRPACRTVNIRQFRNNTLCFLSDLRSMKIDDITNSIAPYVELCWFFPEGNRQYRFSGKLTFDQTARELFWKSLSDQERSWWSWPPPGTARAPDSQFTNDVPATIPQHFCVCQLKPDHVDCSDFSQMPYFRMFYSLVTGSNDAGENVQWTAKMVNP